MDESTIRCDCGGAQSGYPRWHWASCKKYRRKAWDESKIRKELVDKIANITDELDARYGNEPGRAERALYVWFWPPSGSTSIETLVYLLNDARAFLAKAPALPAPGWHLSA